MFVDLKKTETSIGEDGTIEEHEEKYDKVLFGKVCVGRVWARGAVDKKMWGAGRTAPLRSTRRSMTRCGEGAGACGA